MGSDRKRRRKRSSRSESEEEEENSSSCESSESRNSRRRWKGKERKKKKKRYDSEDESSNDDSSSDDGRSSKKRKRSKKKKGRKEKYEKLKDKQSEKIKRAMSEKDKKRRAKELAKQSETPEEQRARRIAKRQEKEERLRLREETDYFGYSNDSNRFGDADLTTPFVWKKKLEQKGIDVKGVNLREIAKKSIRKKQKEMFEEVTKIKLARKKREEEQEVNELMRAQIQKELDSENYEDLERKEEEFHVEQANLRSKIRIKEGRWEPIDLLSKNISLLCCGDEPDDEIDIELQEPYDIIEKLNTEELEQLLREIQVHIDLGVNLDQWNNLFIVVEDEIRVAKLENSGGRGSLHPQVVKAINDLMHGKTHGQLLELRDTIEAKISGENDEDGSGGAVDVEYWETLLKHLKVYISKAFLAEQHKKLLYLRISQLQKQQRERREAQESTDDPNGEDEYFMSDEEDSSGEAADICYSPILIGEKSKDYNCLLALCVSPENDYEQLLESRVCVLRSKLDELEMKERLRLEDVQSAQSFLSQPTDNRWGSADDMYRMESRKPTGEDEAVFSNVAEVKADTYWWHDKYRPRKPRFFNRVKTGYEWNKYNQTHYDHDNPPPKIVQGYKFNVFYPDLVDPTVPPTYVREKCPNSVDYIILRFKAGAPYEDVAFKIVNKEWEESHKRGFKCRFERGILHLYFNFKQFRYRR